MSAFVDGAAGAKDTLTVTKLPGKEFYESLKTHHGKVKKLESPFTALRGDYLR